MINTGDKVHSLTYLLLGKFRKVTFEVLCYCNLEGNTEFINPLYLLLVIDRIFYFAVHSLMLIPSKELA